MGFLHRLAALLCAASFCYAQRPDFGPGGPGGMGQRTKLLDQFDKDGDGHLDAAERKAAREYLATQPRRGRGGFGGFGRGSTVAAGKPGPKLKPSDVKMYGKEPL